MGDSEIEIGGIVRLQSGGPLLTLVQQTPYVNTFGYFDSIGVYHTLEIPNNKSNDRALKDVYA